MWSSGVEKFGDDEEEGQYLRTSLNGAATQKEISKYCSRSSKACMRLFGVVDDQTKNVEVGKYASGINQS